MIFRQPKSLKGLSRHPVEAHVDLCNVRTVSKRLELTAPSSATLVMSAADDAETPKVAENEGSRWHVHKGNGVVVQ